MSSLKSKKWRGFCDAQAAQNVSKLTKDLRPIVDDVRVFTDKIARHPEQLGVRGALDRRPGLK